MGKQEKWQWMKANEPALAMLLLEIRQHFGKPDRVDLSRGTKAKEVPDKRV